MSRLYAIKLIAEVLGFSQQAVQKRSELGRKDRKGQQTEAPWVPAGKQGKALLFAHEALPKDVQAAFDLREKKAAVKAAREAIAQLPAPAAVGEAAPQRAVVTRQPGVIKKGGQVRRAIAPQKMDDWQRSYVDAALVLAVAIEDAAAAADCSVKKACIELAERLLDGTAHPELVTANLKAYLKPRKGATAPSKPLEALMHRLQRIHSLYLEGCKEGDPAKYLVPGKVEKREIKPEDKRAFLQFYCRPSRPAVCKAWKDAATWYAEQGFKQPAVDTWYRIEKKLNVVEKNRGRMTGSAWRSLLPYVSRDVSMFKSNDIWVGDGHTFKAKVASPIHGQAFRPEVTLVIDWRSRKVVGWSVALSESTIAVSDALRNAQIRTRARPLVYYRDNGSGQTGKLIDCPDHGTLARQGIAGETGIPGNPQARGIIERIWPTLLIPLAASYPTFMGSTADKEFVRKTGQALAKAQRAGEASPLLPSWAQFIADLERVIEAYNAEHEHRSLGGMTPNQAYTAFLDPDSIVFGVNDAEIEAMWMPEVERSHSRGVINLFNNEYFLRELPGLVPEGQRIRVRFDIHNADKVWVLDMDGREIGVAEWNGHKRAAFPVPYIEQKREERAKGIKGRAQQQIDRADAELGLTLDAPTEDTTNLAMDLYGDLTKDLAKAEVQHLPQAAADMPAPDNITDLAMYLYGDAIDEQDRETKTAAR